MCTVGTVKKKRNFHVLLLFFLPSKFCSLSIFLLPLSLIFPPLSEWPSTQKKEWKIVWIVLELPDNEISCLLPQVVKSHLKWYMKCQIFFLQNKQIFGLYQLVFQQPNHQLQHISNYLSTYWWCSGLGLTPCVEVTASLELIPAPHPLPHMGGLGQVKPAFQPHGQSTGQHSQFSVPEYKFTAVP